jgi:hypothetical protein
MFLISSDPNNFDVDYTTTICYADSLPAAKKKARQLVGKHGKIFIWKMQEFHIQVEEPKTQAYIVNDKGEVIPCA